MVPQGVALGATPARARLRREGGAEAAPKQGEETQGAHLGGRARGEGGEVARGVRPLLGGEEGEVGVEVEGEGS